jgi:hypothetical protein
MLMYSPGCGAGVEYGVAVGRGGILTGVDVAVGTSVGVAVGDGVGVVVAVGSGVTVAVGMGVGAGAQALAVSAMSKTSVMVKIEGRILLSSFSVNCSARVIATPKQSLSVSVALRWRSR